MRSFVPIGFAALLVGTLLYWIFAVPDSDDAIASTSAAVDIESGSVHRRSPPKNTAAPHLQKAIIGRLIDGRGGSRPGLICVIASDDHQESVSDSDGSFRLPVSGPATLRIRDGARDIKSVAIPDFAGDLHDLGDIVIPPWTISGTIRDESGAPIQSAEVRVIARLERPIESRVGANPSIRAVSDSQGRFESDLIVPLPAVLVVTKIGFAVESRELQVGDDLSKLEVILDRVLPFRVYVVDALGRAVQGAFVQRSAFRELREPFGVPLVDYEFTDNVGCAAFPATRCPMRTIEVSASGFARVIRNLEAASDADRELTIEVSERGRDLKLHMITADGSPPEPPIAFELRFERAMFSGCSDESGIAEIRSIPMSDRAVLRVRSTTWALATPEDRSGIRLPPGDPVLVDVLVDRGATVRGRVVRVDGGDALAGVAVECAVQSGFDRSSVSATDRRVTTTAADGSFQFESLPRELTFLRLRSQEWFSYSNPARNPADRNPVDYTTSVDLRERDVAEIVIVAAPCASVSGTIVDELDADCRGVEVRVVWTKDEWRNSLATAREERPRAVAADGGAFSIKGVPLREEFKVRATLGDRQAESEALILEAGESRQGVTLVLRRDRKVSFRVYAVSDDRAAVPGVTVSVSSKDAQRSLHRSVVTDEKGTAVFEVPAGDYVYWWVFNPFSFPFVPVNTADVGRRHDIRLDRDQEIRLEFKPAMLIQCRLEDAGGNPVGPARLTITVECANTPPAQRIVVADKSGRFTVRGAGISRLRIDRVECRKTTTAPDGTTKDELIVMNVSNEWLDVPADGVLVWTTR